MTRFFSVLCLVCTALAHSQEIQCGFDPGYLPPYEGYLKLNPTESQTTLTLSQLPSSVGTEPFMRELVDTQGLSQDVGQNYLIQVRIGRQVLAQYEADPFLFYVSSRVATVEVHSLDGLVAKNFPVEQVLVRSTRRHDSGFYPTGLSKSASYIVTLMVDVTGPDGFSKRFQDSIEFDPYISRTCQTL